MPLTSTPSTTISPLGMIDWTIFSSHHVSFSFGNDFVATTLKRDDAVEPLVHLKCNACVFTLLP